MIEDIVLVRFPKEAGVYLFSSNDEIIYVGSSKNLYMRMMKHRSCIRQGSVHGYKKDLYQYLQANPFTVEFQMTDNYRQLEQELVEKYNPKYNANRAYTGIAWNGNNAEYYKERYQKYKKEILEKSKQYYESNKKEILEKSKQYYISHEQQKKQYQRIYDNQLCSYNGQTITLCALKTRLLRKGIPHPAQEAKKYLMGGCND